MTRFSLSVNRLRFAVSFCRCFISRKKKMRNSASRLPSTSSNAPLVNGLLSVVRFALLILRLCRAKPTQRFQPGSPFSLRRLLVVARTFDLARQSFFLAQTLEPLHQLLNGLTCSRFDFNHVILENFLFFASASLYPVRPAGLHHHCPLSHLPRLRPPMPGSPTTSCPGGILLRTENAPQSPTASSRSQLAECRIIRSGPDSNNQLGLTAYPSRCPGGIIGGISPANPLKSAGHAGWHRPR